MSSSQSPEVQNGPGPNYEAKRGDLQRPPDSIDENTQRSGEYINPELILDIEQSEGLESERQFKQLFTDKDVTLTTSQGRKFQARAVEERLELFELTERNSDLVDGVTNVSPEGLRREVRSFAKVMSIPCSLGVATSVYLFLEGTIGPAVAGLSAGIFGLVLSLLAVVWLNFKID